MKRFIVSFIVLFVFAVGLPLIANAQTNGRRFRNSDNGRTISRRNSSRRRSRSRRCRPRRNGRRLTRGFNVLGGIFNRSNREYSSDRRYDDRYRRSYYSRHRNAINIGITTGAGAVIGAIVGGKKGALIGGGIGVGAGALYTYGINPKRSRRSRYARRRRF